MLNMGIHIIEKERWMLGMRYAVLALVDDTLSIIVGLEDVAAPDTLRCSGEWQVNALYNVEAIF